jgi:hypothetical protein
MNEGAGLLLGLAASCSMSIAAIVVTGALYGTHGLRDLAARLLRWKAGGTLYAIAFFLPLVIEVLALAIYALLGNRLPLIGLDWWDNMDLPLLLVQSAVPSIVAIFGGFAYALPHFRRDRSRFVASVVLSALFITCIMPQYLAFLIQDNDYPFLLLASVFVPGIFIAVWLYDSSDPGRRDSLWPPILLYFGSVFFLNLSPVLNLALWGDMTALLIERALYFVAAAVIVVFYRSYFFSRSPEDRQSPAEDAGMRRWLPVDLPAALLILAVAGTIVLIVVVSGMIYSANELPAPTGPYKVGKAIYSWTDPSRPETMVYVWYPADVPGGRFSVPVPGGGPTSIVPENDWLDARTAEAFNMSGWLGVTDHTYSRVPVAAAEEKYPVLLASHGNAASPVFMTTTATDLASHGYIVAGIAHPHYAWAIAYPNGTITRMDYDGTAGAIDWKNGSVNGIVDDYRRYSRASDRERSADAAFVLDKLAQLDDNDGLLQGRLDLSRIGMFGSADGGAAAVAMARGDPRIDAAANIDGLWWYTVDETGCDKPLLSILSVDNPNKHVIDDRELADSYNKTAAEMGEIVRRLDAPQYLLFQNSPTAYHVTIQGANSWHFDDEMAFNADVNASTFRESRRYQMIINRYLLDFFGRYLGGEELKYLDRSPAYPDVSIEAKVDGRPVA